MEPISGTVLAAILPDLNKIVKVQTSINQVRVDFLDKDNNTILGKSFGSYDEAVFCEYYVQAKASKRKAEALQNERYDLSEAFKGEKAIALLKAQNEALKSQNEALDMMLVYLPSVNRQAEKLFN